MHAVHSSFCASAGSSLAYVLLAGCFLLAMLLRKDTQKICRVVKDSVCVCMCARGGGCTRGAGRSDRHPPAMFGKEPLTCAGHVHMLAQRQPTAQLSPGPLHHHTHTLRWCWPRCPHEADLRCMQVSAGSWTCVGGIAKANCKSNCKPDNEKQTLCTV